MGRKKKVPVQNYSLDVDIDDRGIISIRMTINEFPLTTETFLRELKDKVGNENISLEVWYCDSRLEVSGGRIDYVTPGHWYFNVVQDYDETMEIFYKTLCEEADPLDICEWENENDEDDEPYMLKADELEELERQYRDKFDESLKDSIYCFDIEKRTELVQLCLDKGTPFGKLKDKSIAAKAKADAEEYKKKVADHQKWRIEEQARIKDLLATEFWDVD